MFLKVLMKNYHSTKYRNKRVRIGDESFDSKKEYHRWLELQILEDAGVIRKLERQVKFVLIPAQREPETITQRGRKIPGKVIEREAVYYADFVYEMDGEIVVEDTKGMKTDVYILKRKLMLEKYGIRIREV